MSIPSWLQLALLNFIGFGTTAERIQRLLPPNYHHDCSGFGRHGQRDQTTKTVGEIRPTFFFVQKKNLDHTALDRILWFSCHPSNHDTIENKDMHVFRLIDRTVKGFPLTWWLAPKHSAYQWSIALSLEGYKRESICPVHLKFRFKSWYHLLQATTTVYGVFLTKELDLHLGITSQASK